MQNFRDLEVWKKAHHLVLHVYQITKKLPASENFGLTINLRRTAISMTSRIAEGAGKASDQEFAAELKRSRALAFELEYLLLLAHDLGYLAAEEHETSTNNLIEVRKMMSGLVTRLSRLP